MESTHILSTKTKRGQTGFTLVELMVAIVLGLLLTGAVAQSYISTKETSRVTMGVGRIQENARFSLYFLTESMRNAGYSGCISRIRNKLNGDPSEYITFRGAITGWDYAGTTSDMGGTSVFTLPNSTLAKPTAVSNWTRTTASGTAESLPAFLAGHVVAGSDVIRFKNYVKLDLTIKTHNDKAVPIVVETAHGMPNNSILMVGDCAGAEIFQHLSNGDGNQVSLGAVEKDGDPGNRKTTGGVANWAREYGPDDSLYTFDNNFYYIGEGASGLPSLFRFVSSLPASLITSADVTADAEELVEGVETLQLLFGEDITDDNNPNRYVSASEVVAWDEVVSLRLGVLLRSPGSAIGEDQSKEDGVDVGYTLLDSIKFSHPTDDRILRYAVNTTVKFRNRGLDNNLAAYVCDATDEGPQEPDNGIETCNYTQKKKK